MPARKFCETGAQFNHFTVIADLGIVNGHTNVKCVCDCGNEWIGRLANIRNGHITSCGCTRITKLIKRNTKHGLSNSALYQVWKGMKARCYNQSHKSYPDYGGRGIIVCDEWRTNPENFISWAVQNGYKKGYEIDRINNNGNYSPLNCRFVDKKENTNNTRRNVNIAINEEIHTLSEWANITGLSYNLIRSRYNEGKRGSELFVPRIRGKENTCATEY